MTLKDLISLTIFYKLEKLSYKIIFNTLRNFNKYFSLKFYKEYVMMKNNDYTYFRSDSFIFWYIYIQKEFSKNEIQKLYQTLE